MDQSIFEYLELLWIKFIVSKYNFFEFLRVLFLYYSNPLFRKIDLSLFFKYYPETPYSISKDFLKSKGEAELYAYGETPLSTIDLIVRECQLTSQDTVFELGCGRGRSVFWMHCFLHCPVVGIEYIPKFVEYANQIKEEFSIKQVEFRLQDMLKDGDFRGATVIYLYGTCLEESAIYALIHSFKKLSSGTKIITVSYPLADYMETPIFEMKKQFLAPFPWGMVDVYLQIKT